MRVIIGGFGHRRSAEQEAELARLPVHNATHAEAAHRAVHPRAKLGGARPCASLMGPVRNLSQTGHARRRRQRVCVERAGMANLLSFHAGPGELQPFHDLAAAGYRPAREAAGKDLGQRRQVWEDALYLLNAARRPAEAGHDFIHDQDDVALFRERAEGTEESARHGKCPARRAGSLDDNRTDVASLLDRRSHDRHVERQNRDALQSRKRDAGGRSPAIFRAGGDVVVPAVEVAIELDDARLAGERSCKTEGHQGRLGTGTREAHDIGGGYQSHDLLCPLDLKLLAGAVVRASLKLCRRCFGHAWVAVAQQQRSMAHHVVDVLVPIDIPLVGPRSVIGVNRERTHEAAVMCDPAGQHLTGAAVQLLRTGMQSGVVLFDAHGFPPLPMIPAPAHRTPSDVMPSRLERARSHAHPGTSLPCT